MGDLGNDSEFRLVILDPPHHFFKILPEFQFLCSITIRFEIDRDFEKSDDPPGREAGG